MAANYSDVAGDIVTTDDIGLLTEVLYKYASSYRERVYDSLKLPQEHLVRLRRLENMHESDFSKYIREMMVIFVGKYTEKAKLGILLDALKSLGLNLATNKVAEKWRKEKQQIAAETEKILAEQMELC